MNEKLRVRFGVRLSWPIANAAIFVIRVDESSALTLETAFNRIKTVLEVSGYADVSKRMIFEIGL